MEDTKRFYTYAYLREDKTPYYIGKGNGYRIYCKKGRPCEKPKDKSRIIFLKQNLTEEEAFQHEKYMIAVFGRKCDGGILHNKSIGGEGPSGRALSEETREKLRIASTGRTHTDKARAKMSESHKGENNYNYGKPRTQEVKDKISKSNNMDDNIMLSNTSLFSTITESDMNITNNIDDSIINMMKDRIVENNK